MTTDIQTTSPRSNQYDVDVDVDTSITNIVENRLPLDLIPCVMSFLEPECKFYDYEYYYSWEELEDMLNDTLPWGPDFCNHLFKIFNDMNDSMFMFYPNAHSDEEIVYSPNHYFDYEITGVNFDRFTWFPVDYLKMPGGGKKWFLDDDGTNYEAMAKMMVAVLKKFDDWYWNNYSGTTLDSNLLKNVLRVYSTLEKYGHMDDEDFDNDDNSIEEASAYH